MSKYSTFILLLIVLLGLGVTAHAQEERIIVANIPFDFEVGGHTLPAGTYTVSRVSITSPELFISSREQGIFILPNVFNSTRPVESQVSFDKVAGKYLLREVSTPIGEFVIDNQREVTKLTQVQLDVGMTSSGSH